MDSFKNLKLSRWRQFEEIDLDLDSNVCVLTGPNGCGKTTVLNVLGRHFGWNLRFLAASFLSENEKKRLYADAWEAPEKALSKRFSGSVRHPGTHARAGA